MSCLSLEQIYLYLEKELSSSEQNKAEDHIAKCSRCKEAFEERKFLLQAAENLPPLEVPADFVHQTMDRIFPAKVSLKGWLFAFSTGLSVIILSSLIYLLGTGQTIPSLFSNFFQFLLEQGKNISLILIKIFKLLSVVVKIIPSLFTQLLEAFRSLTTIISLEMQIILITATIIIFSVLIIGLRRIFVFGEKQ